MIGKNTTFLLVFSVLLCLSCSDSESLTGDNQAVEKNQIVQLTAQNFDKFIRIVAVNMEKNRAFVDCFLKKSARNEMDKQSILKMLCILHISKNVDVTALEKVNNIPQPQGPTSSPVPYYPPTKCEQLLKIRDAMLAECDKYPSGIDDACAAAVMLAYWYKSVDCN